MLTTQTAVYFAYSQGVKLAFANAGFPPKTAGSISAGLQWMKRLVTKQPEFTWLNRWATRTAYLDAKANYVAAHPRIGASHAALGGAVLGAGVGGLTADEGQGERGALRGALVGAGVGGGAGLVGRKLFAAPQKMRANVAVLKAIGAPSKAIERAEEAQKLYKTQKLPELPHTYRRGTAMARHSAQAAAGAAAGGVGGYMLGNKFLGGGAPTQESQEPMGPTEAIPQSQQQAVDAFLAYQLAKSRNPGSYPSMPQAAYGY